MKELIISPPNEKQRLFFESQKRFIGYGGARGGGKSWALRTKFILLALEYSGLKLLLLRKTLPELRENHLLPMLSQLNGIARYKRDERAFIFPNGSRIRLGYCDTENDIYQYQGQEYDVIGVEECTHFTFSQIQFLTTCNRTTREDFKPRMYFTGNPGGVGHNWFKRLFVKGRYEENEDPEDYVFIPATIDDNTVLMNSNPEYVSRGFSVTKSEKINVLNYSAPTISVESLYRCDELGNKTASGTNILYHITTNYSSLNNKNFPVVTYKYKSADNGVYSDEINLRDSVSILGTVVNSVTITVRVQWLSQKAIVIPI